MKIILIRTVLLFLTLSQILISVGFAEITHNSISGAWLFDEGNGQIAKDASGKSKDGVLRGGAKWVMGKFGQALEFNGKDSYVEIPLPEILSNISKKSFTIAFWANIKDISGSGTVWTRILEARNNNTSYVQFDIQINDGELGINLINEGTEKTVMVNSPIRADTWYHIAGVWDVNQDSVKLYLNGVPQTGVGTTPASPGNQRILNIGRRSDGDLDTYFNGIIDDFGIFNIALTEDDIKNLMEKGLRPFAAVSFSDKLTINWGKIKRI